MEHVLVAQQKDNCMTCVDPDVVLLDEPVENAVVTCEGCKYATAVTIEQTISEEYFDKVGKARLLHNIDNCTFTKTVYRCKKDKREKHYRTRLSSCDNAKASPNYIPEPRFPDQAEEQFVHNTECARKIGV